LIPIFVITVVLGVTFTMKVTSTTFQSPISIYNSEKIDEQIPEDKGLYTILGTEACSCLGNVYSDTTPPVVVVKSPPNNSIIYIDTIIYIEASDNFPAMTGGVPFVPEYLFYHWNDATSNITIYDAAIDGAPPNDEPVKVELTLPSDEVGVTHVLNIYAVDYEMNWLSVGFVYTTALGPTTTTTTIEPTTTTTTIEPTTTTNSSVEVTTEESSDTTAKSTTLDSSTINLTTGFSTYIIFLVMMILLPIKKARKNWKK
jgi:hypothetical protein